MSTNNARQENLEKSKLYKPLLDNGQRCVLVIEGFYEWQTTNSKTKRSERKVYFIHMPQTNEQIKIEDKSSWTCDVKLMFLAGLFDIWYDANGDSIYSFSVVTFESDKSFGWLHHRTPAILETEQQISDWLDFERVPKEEALRLIRQPEKILWYEVSNFVNSTRNQTDKCKQPIKSAQAGSSIMRWLKQKTDKEDDDDDDKNISAKRSKLD